jgi:Haem-degrading
VEILTDCAGFCAATNCDKLSERGNELLGAIGVSGASRQEDEEIVRAGLAAL